MQDGPLEEVSLPVFLKAARPDWKQSTLRAVGEKLSKVGIHTTAQLVDAVRTFAVRTRGGDANLNQRLRERGEKAFTAETLAALRRQAKAFYPRPEDTELATPSETDFPATPSTVLFSPASSEATSRPLVSPSPLEAAWVEPAGDRHGFASWAATPARQRSSSPPAELGAPSLSEPRVRGPAEHGADLVEPSVPTRFEPAERSGAGPGAEAPARDETVARATAPAYAQRAEPSGSNEPPQRQPLQQHPPQGQGPLPAPEAAAVAEPLAAGPPAPETALPVGGDAAVAAVPAVDGRREVTRVGGGRIGEGRVGDGDGNGPDEEDDEVLASLSGLFHVQYEDLRQQCDEKKVHAPLDASRGLLALLLKAEDRRLAAERLEAEFAAAEIAAEAAAAAR